MGIDFNANSIREAIRNSFNPNTWHSTPGDGAEMLGNTNEQKFMTLVMTFVKPCSRIVFAFTLEFPEFNRMEGAVRSRNCGILFFNSIAWGFLRSSSKEKRLFKQELRTTQERLEGNFRTDNGGEGDIKISNGTNYYILSVQFHGTVKFPIFNNKNKKKSETRIDRID